MKKPKFDKASADRVESYAPARLKAESQRLGMWATFRALDAVCHEAGWEAARLNEAGL